MKMMNDKLKAAIYGLAIGDAIGVPVEFKPSGSFYIEGMTGYGSHNQPPGTWSDDTSMTIATCDSIRECGKIDIRDMYQKFCDWYHNDEYAIGSLFDIGGTTARALATGKGADSEISNGNGSLMRILPLAFTDASDEEIEAVSAITHAHQISRRACVLYVSIARSLLNGETLKAAIRKLDTEPPFHRLGSIFSLDVTEINSSGYVVDTLEAALWSLANSDNYRDAVLTAVHLGDDTDTVGAVTGGLAGILYGFDGIPAEWIGLLRGKEIIDRCLF